MLHNTTEHVLLTPEADGLVQYKTIAAKEPANDPIPLLFITSYHLLWS